VTEESKKMYRLMYLHDDGVCTEFSEIVLLTSEEVTKVEQYLKDAGEVGLIMPESLEFYEVEQLCDYEDLLNFCTPFCEMVKP
jgi:hypothetical protein